MESTGSYARGIIKKIFNIKFEMNEDLSLGLRRTEPRLQISFSGSAYKGNHWVDSSPTHSPTASLLRPLTSCPSG